MLVSNFISLVVLMFGLAFVNRIYSNYKKQNFLSKKSMTKIGTLHFALLFILYFLFFSKPFLFWLSSVLSFFLFPVLLFLVFKIHQHQFHSDFLRFLSITLLSMKRGESFMLAIDSSLKNEKWRQEPLLRSLVENVAFSQQKIVDPNGPLGPFWEELQRELIEIKENQHQAVDRLYNLRKKLRERLIFRQKSRQIWGYFISQVSILSLIYIGILSYILFVFGFSNHKQTLFISISLYLLGVLWVFVLLKGKKWHI